MIKHDVLEPNREFPDSNRYQMQDENMVRLIEMIIERHIDADPLCMEYRSLSERIVEVLHDGRVSFVEPVITYGDTIQP